MAVVRLNLGLWGLILFLLLAITATAQVPDQPQRQATYEQDFAFYCQTIADNFAYFDGVQRKAADWEKARAYYRARVSDVHSKADLLRLLESANNELFNGHVTLNANLPSSNRIIPSGADLWAARENGRFVISDIRAGFSADLSGLRKGMVLQSFNGVPIAEAVKAFLPVARKEFTEPMYEYAVNMLLAGTHDKPREIAVRSPHDGVLTFLPDKEGNRVDKGYSEPLSSRTLFSGIGYIRINNSLGDTDLIHAFDQVLDTMMASKGLILDLRETPSGGTTTVARGILGRFISKEVPYQEISYPEELRLYGVVRNQMDLVSPRGKPYTKPVVVLVGRWTGSVGEGLTIGFDAAHRAEIAGTKMASLLGAMCSYQLPNTKIGFSIPCQKTLQVNGKPREDFVPSHPIPNGEDAITFAEQLLRHHK